MTEPKDLLLVIEQLRRSNRRWKTLALAACFVLILVALVGLAAAEAATRRMHQAMAEAVRIRVDAQLAANPGQPR